MDASAEATIQEALRRIELLKLLDTFDNRASINAMKYLFDAYTTFSNIEFRRELGDELAKIGFAELSTKIKMWINTDGPFTDDGVWEVTYLFLLAVWSFTDGSLLLCQNMSKQKKITTLLQASVNILLNVSKVMELKEKFYELDTISVLQSLLLCSNNMIRSVSFMTIAHVVKEENNERIVASTDIIRELAKRLKSALYSKDYRFEGFSAEEIADALGLLAVNDAVGMTRAISMCIQAVGFTVWMDVGDVSGSSLQAMTDAVESASLVLICVSERYKNNPICRIGQH